MPHWKTLMDRDFIGSCDIEGRGDVTLTIAKVEGGSIARAGTSKKERKPVITFQGSPKKWVCNTTNCTTIESLYSSDYTKWPSKRITIYAADTTMMGKPCRGIRVRPRVPPTKAQNTPANFAPPIADVHAELTGNVDMTEEEHRALIQESLEQEGQA